MEEITLTKLGVIGLLLIVAGRAIYTLWSYGESKAATALTERDALRTEREALRLAHEAEKAAIHKAHDQELNRVRMESAQQINAIRTQATERMEELLIEVTRFTSSLEPMLTKLFERVQRRR